MSSNSCSCQTIEWGASKFQALDLYRRNDVERVQCVLVFCHGGGWVDREKEEFADIGRTLALRVDVDCAVAVLNYRLTDLSKAPDCSVQHPLHTEDAANGVRHLYEHREELNLCNAFLLCGHSAGAHMCGLMALDKRFLPASLHVVGCIGVSGIYDVRTFDADFAQYRDAFLGAVFGAYDGDAWHRLSPQGCEVSRLPQAKRTPWLIIHSASGDKMVNERQSIDFAERLRAEIVGDASLVELHTQEIDASHWRIVFKLLFFDRLNQFASQVIKSG
jgi:acetyl esterase/lipase